MELVADYTANLVNETISIQASEARDATYQFAFDNNGDFTNARLSFTTVPGFSTPADISFNTSQGDVFVDGGLLDPIASDYIAAAGVNFDTLAFISDHSAMAFEYQSFGFWLTGLDTGVGVISSMTAGAPTLIAGIPNNNIATYNGASTGLYVDADGIPFLAFADFTADVNFGTLDVTGIAATNTQVMNANSGAVGANTDLNYTGSGTLAVDGTFSATIVATDLAGDMNGLLYGPAAEELGAVFDMSGLNGRFIGAVGAAQ